MWRPESSSQKLEDIINMMLPSPRFTRREPLRHDIIRFGKAYELAVDN